MSAITKRPAFQFYPKEWIWDLNLRECSIEARGLWADMLCLMHDGEPHGHLTASESLMLRVSGLTAERYAGLISELESKGVFSRTADGVIYSRRMVRDEARRATCASNGKMGGNPALIPDHYRVAYPTESEGSDKAGGSRREEEEEVITAKWENFKSFYPAHRLDEEKACRAFISRDGEADAIVSGLHAAIASEDWEKQGGRYVPKASRFISEGMYADFLRAAPVPVKPEFWKPKWGPDA